MSEINENFSKDDFKDSGGLENETLDNQELEITNDSNSKEAINPEINNRNPLANFIKGIKGLTSNIPKVLFPPMVPSPVKIQPFVIKPYPIPLKFNAKKNVSKTGNWQFSNFGNPLFMTLLEVIIIYFLICWLFKVCNQRYY